ncbi:MAG: DUF523 and DUF1722 domain-containing protein, partial [Proteobacteria bacterium]|nr:DUF523 and DUF1722 domain-containing protein [Pseudomonadota bacterium]
MEDRVRIGVSACLLGEKVRYDGGHKRDPFITKTLSAWFEFVPVCPEAECGLGVPREAMHLTGNPESPRLVTRTTGRDLTDRMLSWARARLDGLAEQDLCGFIFKSRSPSSGMERVPVYTEAGMSVRRGRGLFAAAFMDRFPRLPVEDEGRLSGMGIRENFIERVFTLRRWRDLLDRDPSVRGLMGFHAAHKLLIMSHSPRHMREMGR